MRHMMPKEILDAVDLQPQYRTLSEIRDYMLQLARQRADVYVGDVCRSTKKPGAATPFASTNTSTPTATTVSAPVPMDVSQMSSNVSSSETVEQESDTYQYEQDQDCDGDELFAVKGKGKGGFKGTCYKCGMRGHKADRCWQKGKCKGGKGEWETGNGGSKGKGWPKGNGSHSRHTWDNSWHHSNWHGKTYGLEVNPWTAVEPVPYLCAVSLNGSCEDFSEPKRMSSTSMHTSRSQRQQWRYGDERVDECITALRQKVFRHQQGSGPRKLSAHQVSYLAAPGGDSKEVHHVCGSGWRRLSAIMYSG